MTYLVDDKNLHDFIYQNLRKTGIIVYLGS